MFVPEKLRSGTVTIDGECAELRCALTRPTGCAEWEAKMTGPIGSECLVTLTLPTAESFDVTVYGSRQCNSPAQKFVVFHDDGTAEVDPYPPKSSPSS